MQSNFKENIFMQKGQRSDPDKVRGALRSAKAACIVQHEERILSSLAVLCNAALLEFISNHLQEMISMKLLE